MKTLLTFELIDSYGHGVGVAQALKHLGVKDDRFEIEFPDFGGGAAQGVLVKVEVERGEG